MSFPVFSCFSTFHPVFSCCLCSPLICLVFSYCFSMFSSDSPCFSEFFFVFPWFLHVFSCFYMFSRVFLRFPCFYVFLCFPLICLFSSAFLCFPRILPVFQCFSMFSPDSPCFLVFLYVSPWFSLFFHVFLYFPLICPVFSCFSILPPDFLCFLVFLYVFFWFSLFSLLSQHFPPVSPCFVNVFLWFSPFYYVFLYLLDSRCFSMTALPGVVSFLYWIGKCDILYQLICRGKKTGLSSEPARWLCDNCQRMSDFDSCQSNRIHTDGVGNWKASQAMLDLLWHLTSAYIKCVYGWAGLRTLRHNQIFSDG